MLDAVNDLPIFSTEDDVAVFSHNLHDQELPAEVAELVEVFDGKPDDALQFRL